MDTCACCRRGPIEVRITVTVPEDEAGQQEMLRVIRKHLRSAMGLPAEEPRAHGLDITTQAGPGLSAEALDRLCRNALRRGSY